MYNTYPDAQPRVTDRIRRFALIIGIDNYPHRRKLAGAVADAKAMEEYLEKTLGVPEHRIHMLLDENATRKAIIEAFQRLLSDRRIQRGDPIVIFFAGHGGEVPAPPSWGLDRKIQCILPYDYKDRTIYPIPDRTIGALIENVAKEKGDNITVIFDCCHSAGCVRDEDEEIVTRGVDLDPLDIPENLDDAIFDGRTGAFPESLTYHGLRSHVLLAACSENELAHEHEGRGHFTLAVLTILQGCAINDLTYIDLIKQIHLANQRPQCHGVNRHRILFNAKVSAGKQVRHAVHIDDDGPNCVIAAGSVHGVSHEGKFTLYNNGGHGLGVLTVGRDAVIGDFQTTVAISSGNYLRNAAYAKLSPAVKVPLLLSPVLKRSLWPMVTNGTDHANIRLVEDVNEARLYMAMKSGLVTFETLDSRVTGFGLSKLPHTVTLDSVPRVLATAAHYYWYLDLVKKANRMGTNLGVAIDLFALKKHYDDNGVSYYLPIGSGFCQKDSRSHTPVIDIVVDPDKVYGIEITNNNPFDLYLNAFLFNHSSFSIVPYYTQPSAGRPDAPLKHGKTFSIGYGPWKTTPFNYWLDDGQDIDVGHLKIFFTTRPVDLTDVAQASPFADMNVRRRTNGNKNTREGGLRPWEMQTRSEVVDDWFTVEIPIVQRRSKMV